MGRYVAQLEDQMIDEEECEAFAHASVLLCKIIRQNPHFQVELREIYIQTRDKYFAG
jgi:hypothetical protein